MFGAAWLNVGMAAVLALVGMLSLARAVVCGSGERVGNTWHAVMAAGMAAMALPAVDPLPQRIWALCFAAAALWWIAVLIRLGPIYGSGAMTIGPTAWRTAAGQALHQFCASLLMLLALALGHGVRHVGVVGTGAPHHAHASLGGAGSTIGAALWLIAAGFALVAGRQVARMPAAVRAGRPGSGLLGALGSPVVGAGCATVMPAGMAAMAATMW